MKFDIESVYLFINILLMIATGGGADEEYDYIVVGAGSAGCVLANRLSRKDRVLLLEKGGRPNLITEVPALSALMYFTANADKYVAEKQPGFGLGLTDQQVGWLRGRGLGATSLINYLMYVRGHREDYDRWAADGNPGWAYDDVLEAFKCIENANLPYVNGTVRGVGGELDVSEVPRRTEIARAYIEGCKEYGLNHLVDYNDGTPFGVAFLQANLRRGRRCHAEKAFLHDIRRRKTLTVKTGALVTKLRIDRSTMAVEGVEYRMSGRSYYAKAKKEVILSAGAYGSPQILMLSGIGPKSHLEEMGIEVVKDLPVGQMIYDHVTYPALIFKLNASVSPMIQDILSPISWGQFLLSGKGPLTVPTIVVEALSFVKTEESNETLPIPDIEFIFASGSFNLDFGLLFRHEFRFPQDTYDAIWRPFNNKHVWSVLPMLYHPRSKGHMKLRSTDPTDRPKLYANYFSDRENKDLKTILASIRIAQKIAKMPSLAKYGSEIYLGAVPGCRREEPDSDAFWECQVRHLALSLWHQVASCKMGPKTDPEAVVDNKLRVYGIEKLRVADTSIIPRPLSVHTNVPSTMVGQRAYELISADTSSK